MDERIVQVRAVMWGAFDGMGFPGESPPIVTAATEELCRAALKAVRASTADVFLAPIATLVAFDNHVDPREASAEWLATRND